MYFEQKLETYVPVRNDIHYFNFIKRNAQIGITNHAHLIHAAHDNSLYKKLLGTIALSTKHIACLTML